MTANVYWPDRCLPPLPILGATLTVTMGRVFKRRLARNRCHTSIPADTSTALTEFARVLRGGGSVLVFEGLGLFEYDEYSVPTELRTFMKYLENECGFIRHGPLRTDFRFSSASEAAELMGWFFGPEVGDLTRRYGQRNVVEYTGMWITSQGRLTERYGDNNHVLERDR